MISNNRNNNQEDQDLFCMTIMLGRHAVLDGPLRFSFYFGSKQVGTSANNNDIRIKFCMNPQKYDYSEMYTLELFGEYRCSGENIIPDEEINEIRDFFKKYKVLFAGAWEEQIYEWHIVNYLSNIIGLPELIQNSLCYNEHAELLKSITTVDALEKVVRRYHIFNMND